jgi:hypothetical protein
MKNNGPAIIDGVYYPLGYKGSKPTNKTNSTYKNWRINEEREIHRRDITQAYKNNKPNPEFIRNYPEESKQYFSEEDIKRYGNEY